MTLSFKQKFKNGKPTFFMEKIWKGFDSHPQDFFSKNRYPPNGFCTSVRYNKMIKPKIHTIREDKSNRWKAGRDIHFVINNRQPDRYQFAPVIKCKSVQAIVITELPVMPVSYLYKWNGKMWAIYIDGHKISIPNMMLLAKNDGFNSLDEMLEYFEGSFKGKIIHWTDFKY